MGSPLVTSFVRCSAAQWGVDSIDPVTGPSLPHVPTLAVIENVGHAHILPPALVHAL